MWVITPRAGDNSFPKQHPEIFLFVLIFNVLETFLVLWEVGNRQEDWCKYSE